MDETITTDIELLKALPISKSQRRRDDLSLTLQSICREYDVPEPAEFLATVMAGRDPRYDISPLFALIVEIERTRLPGEPPTLEEWQEIVQLISQDDKYKYARVESTESIKAAERLLEYLQPKLKSLDITARNAHFHAVSPVRSLSKKEAEEFEEWFIEEF